MFNDSTFWAAYAGQQRRNANDAEEANYEWQAHAQNLEARINRLNRVARSWQDEAIDNGAHSYVANEVFKEVNGHSVREHIGNDEMERRLEEGRRISQKYYRV